MSNKNDTIVSKKYDEKMKFMTETVTNNVSLCRAMFTQADAIKKKSQ